MLHGGDSPVAEFWRGTPCPSFGEGQWPEKTEAVKGQALRVRRVIKAPPHIWPKRHNPQLTF